MTAFGSSSLLITLLLTATADGSVTPVGKRVEAFALKDVLGTTRSLADWKDSKAVVVVFLGVECPLAQKYASRLAELADRYKDKHVQFVGIDSNQQDSLAQIAHYARVNKVQFPMLKDPGSKVADQFGALRTPEAFVLDSSGVVRYWGQIDDQFGVGYTRSKPTHRYLEEALDDLLASKSVRVAAKESVGCRIGRVHHQQATGNVTYSNQISRILQARCVICHRAGEIAPFALTGYEEASGWAETIRDVINDQRMPPWHANPHYGKFSNDARLTDEEKQLIFEWIKNGTPEGDRSQLPPKFQYADGWRIPGPDLVVRMPKPFKVAAKGTVEYQYFITDPGFKHDVWIRAAEGRAGNRNVVHHMVLFFMPPEQKEPRPEDPLVRTVGSFAPGTPPMIPPDGISRRVPAGSKLVFQMHYTPNGTEQVDQSEVGLTFADPKTVRKELFMGATVNFQFLIPPGAADYRVEAKETFDEDTLIYAFLPHMHYRGKAFRFSAVTPGTKPDVLLDVPRYDFNWQNVYWPTEPILMRAGSKMQCDAAFDNSETNLANPNPAEPVHWGEQTWEEMMVGSYYYCSAEQDLTLGPPRITRRNDGKYEVAFRYRPLNPAKAVYLAGSFNKWAPAAERMSGPDKEGWYTMTRVLPEGRHEYKFVLDGKAWRPDPGNSVQAGPDHNSVLTVGSVPPTSVSQLGKGR